MECLVSYQYLSVRDGVRANATASSNDDPASAYEVRPISTSYPSPSSCNDDDDDDDDDDDGR